MRNGMFSPENGGLTTSSINPHLVGSAALYENPLQIPESVPGHGEAWRFSDVEREVIGHLSLGRKIGGTAEQMSRPAQDITSLADVIKWKLAVSTHAGAVNRAILKGLIEIERESGPSIELRPTQKKMLSLIASGRTLRKSAEHMCLPRPLFNAGLANLCAQLNANGPVHLVRRGHELGLL